MEQPSKFLVLSWGREKNQRDNPICPAYALSTTGASKPYMQTLAGLDYLLILASPMPLTQKESMGWMESLGRKGVLARPGYLAGPILLSSFSPPPPKDKHSKEVWIKNKPLSDETSFSWALRYFNEDLLSHSFIPWAISWH